jgi:tripartite-type tricarboxylate transporter receptor subunit TctC
MARLTGQDMSARLGQQVIVENRPGAGSTIGFKAAAAAEPDGYTLLFGSSGSLGVAPALTRGTVTRQRALGELDLADVPAGLEAKLDAIFSAPQRDDA